MRSADTCGADELEEFLVDCLAEHDITNVDIITYTEGFEDILAVRKEIGDEYIARRLSFNIDLYEMDDLSTLKKKIAMEAETIANEFHKELSTIFTWRGVRVKVSKYDGGWAKCCECGTEVQFDRSGTFASEELAELSTPKPFPIDPERTVANLSGTQAIALRLYLIGELQRFCDFDCPMHDTQPKDLNTGNNNISLQG